MKKARAGGGKTEIGNVGKNAKVGSSFPTGGRLLSVSAGKTSTAPSYKTAKTHKSSTTFGVVWIPRRKTNKYYKDTVFNSHKNDRSYDRAPSMFNYMSGDSSNHETLLKKKDDESALVVPENTGGSSLAATSTGVAIAVSELPPDLVSINQDEKQELIKRDTEDDKEAAGDTNNKKRQDNTDNKTQTEKEGDQEVKSEKERLGDNVDSVVLRSPPPNKVRSRASTPKEEEEDCGIKCLYYTLLCCDCVLM